VLLLKLLNALPLLSVPLSCQLVCCLLLLLELRNVLPALLHEDIMLTLLGLPIQQPLAQILQPLNHQLLCLVLLHAWVAAAALLGWIIAAVPNLCCWALAAVL
jgi:hypothetical protein